VFKDRRDGMVYLHWCALTATAVGAYLGWLAFAAGRPTFNPLPQAGIFLYLLGVIVASFWVEHGLRTADHRFAVVGLVESIPHTLQQLLRYVVVILALAFLTKEGALSRKFLVGYLVVMAVVLTLANVYFPRLLAWVVYRRHQLRTVLVARPGEIATLAGLLAGREQLGVTVVGWVDHRDAEDAPPPLPKLGRLRDLRHILPEHNVAQVVISQDSYSAEEGRAIAQCAEETGCRVRFVMQVQRYFPDQPVRVEHEGAFTFLAPANEPLANPVNQLVKRAVDIAVALPMVLFVLPPLACVVWLAQRCQSPGPVLHRQQRSGLDRRRFLMFKFRTMHPADSPAALAIQAKQHDARVYPFGRFLRRTSLDEFPQFLNVLLGDMSVSGPRPHLLEHDEQFARIVKTYYTRHFVKPGITGLAQCRGYRGEISEPSLLRQRIGCDMLYIRQWSLSLDLQILLQTARQVMFPPRTAY